MKSGKKSKRIIIIISIAVLLIGAAVCFCISGFPRPSLKKISTSVDNSYRNDVRNEYNANAVGGDNKLFFEAYNHFLFSGIYQIDSGLTRRIYTAELSFTPYIPFSPYVYRGRMIDVDNGAICSLNYLNGKFEPFLDPPMKDGEKPSSVFVTGGELYYYTSTDDDDDIIRSDIYHYVDDKTIDLAASKELFGENYYPEDFCGDIMYYSLERDFSEYGYENKKFVPNDFEADFYDCGIRKLYKYNLKERKTESRIDFSCLDKELPKKNCALFDFFVTDNKVYLFVEKLEKLEDHYPKKIIEHDAMLQDIGHASKTLIYRYDIKTDKLEKLMDIDDCSLTINGYGDKVYVNVTTESYYGEYGEIVQLKDELYAFSDDSDKPTALHDAKDADKLYIFDEEWLYYSTGANKLYRIHPDGSNNECIF